MSIFQLPVGIHKGDQDETFNQDEFIKQPVCKCPRDLEGEQENHCKRDK